jgi:hypothetical protein
VDEIERYPVDLEDVYRYAYSEKRNAKAAIYEMHFVEGEDFVIHGILLENQQNSLEDHRGRPAERIMLSVQTTEHLIARKVTPIFEIYRQCRKEVTRQVKGRSNGSIQDGDDIDVMLKALVDTRRQVRETKGEIVKVSVKLKDGSLKAIEGPLLHWLNIAR